MLFLQLRSHCLNSLFSKLKPLSVFNLPLYKSLFVHPGSHLVLFASFLIVFLDSSMWHSIQAQAFKMQSQDEHLQQHTV